MANKFESFPQEKFVLVNENRPLRDKELVTKPRGFFADAMYRFSRNKGSIVAAVIIGILLLYAIIAPLCTPYKVSNTDAYLRYALPKLFDNPNIDFLDGSANKTVGLNTFIQYYGIGAETGTNAVKRQQYSTSISTTGETVYNIRLDSYRSTGVVFMRGVTNEQLVSIQEYQDANNVQIIYPITEPSKRPTATQDLNNANFWYETKFEGNKTVPTGYEIAEDGSISFTNIYREFKKPSLSSSASYYSSSSTPNIRIEPADDGFLLSFKTVTVIPEGEGDAGEKISYDYISLFTEDDMNFLSLSENKSEAATFHYDSAKKGLYSVINGHDSAELDGNYYFGLRATVGSDILVFSEAEYNPDEYVLLNAIGKDGKTEITDFSKEQEAYLASTRVKESKGRVYLSVDALSGKASLGGAVRDGKQVYAKTSDDGFLLLTSNKLGKAFALSASGNEPAFSLTTEANGSKWHFDEANGGVYTTLTGFADSNKNGDYYWAFAAENDNTSLKFVKKDAFSETLLPMVVVQKDAATKATSIANGFYYLTGEYVSFEYTRYYANGNYTGDNYFSKMRVEGEGNYKYAYAINTGDAFEIRVNYYEYYRYYHEVILKDGIRYPFFIFGANDSGQDIFVCLASGARFSFLLAIAVSVVNLVAGAIYGAIEGYYGGRADLIMQRIVEILSAVPFMIVITLLKYHMKGSSHVLILFISFFLTGWIGESGTVRMQFYRFKNQEYVLAARTLGARDRRIMFRHIFPNALGTIVTSSVLVIPGMIFSETSLSYLGIINLSTGDMTSVGTMLANGQQYMTTYPHILIFPAVFISLLMLTFNLFGNGLRDAFNPSLRGTED